MRDRRDVLDGIDFQSGDLQGADGRLSTNTWAFDKNVNIPHTHRHHALGYGFSSQLSGIGSPLASSL